MTVLRRTSHPPRGTLAWASTLVTAAMLTGCAQGASPTADPTSVAPEPLATSTSATATPPNDALAGRTIALDPGHNGGNAAHPDEIARQVPDGRGGTKACNTTGTATDDGYTESAFTWAVAQLLSENLESKGARVIMSRDDDDGVGPCVDERGTFADGADALVSIHANGSESSRTKGFHVIVADPGTSPELEEQSNALATSVSAAMAESFTPNRAYGKEAISPRPDLAGLNNASVPAIIVECGEMRNRDEAKVMESEDGQRRYAEAIAAGIDDWF
ncbi:N-acetylmuramoyl-L-alanine amidase [Brevibacterium casei]|uniref:Putative glutaminase n=2 Tax=Brevibacterium casei TaxID=33889 RepID=K9B223_9MICO|nr:N-acetylmuramoyl-L-alanine amidase [Brevibacterium casei]EKU47805.1 putative glutaminase [Brevibacterium casei S18]